MLNHCRESRFKIAFRTRGQHLQALHKSVSCGPNVGRVNLEVRIARISEKGDGLNSWKKLMQQFHPFWPQNTERDAHTRKVAVRSTETFDKTRLDRVRAAAEDNGYRFGRRLCSKRRREVVCK